MINWPIVVIFTIIYTKIRFKRIIECMLDRTDRTCDIAYKAADLLKEKSTR